MSTDWGIGCRDCAENHLPKDREEYFTGEWNNCRDVENLTKICEAADQILALDDKLGRLASVDWYEHGRDARCYGLADFMRKHRGHRLAPMNEYGQFDDQCWRHSYCESCKYPHACVLKLDHEGPCQRKQ